LGLTDLLYKIRLQLILYSYCTPAISFVTDGGQKKINMGIQPTLAFPYFKTGNNVSKRDERSVAGIY